MSFQANATEIVKDVIFVAPSATAHWWVRYLDDPLGTALALLTITLIVLRIYYVIKTSGKKGWE